MAIAYSYPKGTPTLTDTLVGIQYEVNKDPAVKQFGINDIVDLVPVVYTTLPYKVYTALLTQVGGSVPQVSFGDETFTKGVTYTITANPNNENLLSIGAPSNVVGTIFVCSRTTTAEFNVALQLSWDLGAPVVTVLENTIGNIWFTYEGISAYVMNSNGLLPSYKTWGISDSVMDNNGIIQTVYINVNNQGPDVLYIRTQGGDFNGDSLLSNTPIEIRVYN